MFMHDWLPNHDVTFSLLYKNKFDYENYAIHFANLQFQVKQKYETKL